MDEIQYRYKKNSLIWDGSVDAVVFDEREIQDALLNLSESYHFVQCGDQIGLVEGGQVLVADASGSDEIGYLTAVHPLPPEQLGDPSFMAFHGVRYPLYTGSMANGIASEEMVIALGRENILSSFGAAGLAPARLESAIQKIQTEIPDKPFASCLIHSPNEPALENAGVELYLKHGVRTVEASAFLKLTPSIVMYRVLGLSVGRDDEVDIQNRVIAKVSRREVAEQFMRPAPERILKALVADGRITEAQARLAERVPVADDITVEADSGGHTDNRPLVCLLPSIQALRDEIEVETGHRVRVGAAGGIGTPTAMLGAFAMGADYIVTGSINQASREAGTSQHCKEILAQANMADVMMAPAADMFEMGVKLQVLKRGTLFPLRAQKLYDLYKTYNAIEDIPAAEREKLEKQVFQKPLDDVWQHTVQFFQARDPNQIQRAQENSKRKMALVFRWYLGLSSNWANAGEAGREMDYQIWCGPAMGAFNAWAQGSYLAEPENRKVVDITNHMIQGALYLYRLQMLRGQGLYLPPSFQGYRPTPSITV